MSAERLPCGCLWDEVGDTFVFQPCSLDCPQWAHVRDAFDRSGKPLRVVMDPDAPNSVAPVLRCPACGKIQDAHTDVSGGGAVPGVGDLGICFDCGCVFEFAVGDPRVLDAVELLHVLASHPDVARAVEAIRRRGGPR